MMKLVVPIVLVRAVKALPDDERLSGIDKNPTAGRWTVSKIGIVGEDGPTPFTMIKARQQRFASV